MLCTARSLLTTQPRTIFVMSTVLELNCWILGNEPRRIFPVEVPSSKTVGHLKEAIKDKKKHTFSGIDADLLDLWKVSNRIQHINNDEFILSLKVNINLTTNLDPDPREMIKVKDDIRDGIELKPWSRLSKLFVDGAEDEHLHIIVQCPPRRYLLTIIRYSLLTRHNPFVSARYRHRKNRS
jgi:hypothetical protein